jgi:hypothetical protein
MSSKILDWFNVDNAEELIETMKTALDRDCRSYNHPFGYNCNSMPIIESEIELYKITKNIHLIKNIKKTTTFKLEKKYKIEVIEEIRFDNPLKESQQHKTMDIYGSGFNFIVGKVVYFESLFLNEKNIEVSSNNPFLYDYLIACYPEIKNIIDYNYYPTIKKENEALIIDLINDYIKKPLNKFILYEICKLNTIVFTDFMRNINQNITDDLINENNNNEYDTVDNQLTLLKLNNEIFNEIEKDVNNDIKIVNEIIKMVKERKSNNIL